MFPNIKKSRFLHQLSQMRPCKAKCIQQSFQFCVIDRKLNGICLVEKFHQFTKNQQPQQQTCKAAKLLCVYKLLYKTSLIRRHNELKILAAQIYPATPQKAQRQPQLCKLWRVELVDTICYLQ